MQQQLRFAALAVLCWSTALAAEAPAPDTRPAMRIVLRNERGHLLDQLLLHPQDRWSSIACGDFLTLHERLPDNAACEVHPDPPPGDPPPPPPEDMNIMVTECVAVGRSASCTRPCPPLHPSQLCYRADFPNGAVALVRLPQEEVPATATATWQGRTVRFKRITPLQLARFVLTGTDSTLPADSDAFTAVCLADCRSLVASQNRHSRKAALEFAAAAISCLLESYRSEHGAYPATLDELWQGKHAVVSLSPANPYDWPQPLCTAQQARSAKPGLLYLPQALPGQPVSGYLLGVRNAGAAATVPAGATVPADLPPVVQWIYQAPSPAT